LLLLVLYYAMSHLKTIISDTQQFYTPKTAITNLPENKLSWQLILMLTAAYALLFFNMNVATGGYAFGDIVRVFQITLAPAQNDTARLLIIARDVLLLILFLFVILPITFALSIKGVARLVRRTITFFRLLNIFLYTAVYKASLMVILALPFSLYAWLKYNWLKQPATDMAELGYSLLSIFFLFLVAYGISLSLKKILTGK